MDIKSSQLNTSINFVGLTVNVTVTQSFRPIKHILQTKPIYDCFNPVLHELFYDFNVKVHSTGRLIHAVEGYYDCSVTTAFYSVKVSS